MSLVDIHEIAIERIIDLEDHTITLIDKLGNEFPDVKCLFNSVDYGLKLDSIDGDPMGEKTNVYIQTKELVSKGITIDTDRWRVRGKKGKYKEVQTFLAEIPKEDSQLPGIVLFLTLIDPNSVKWEDVEV